MNYSEKNIRFHTEDFYRRELFRERNKITNMENMSHKLIMFTPEYSKAILKHGVKSQDNEII